MSLHNRIPEIIAELEASVRAAETAGAKLIEEAAKRRVPVDDGELQQAIHTEQAEDGVYVVAGTRKVFYGHMVEHGTTHSPPRPFLVPAAEESRAAVVALTSEAIRKVTG